MRLKGRLLRISRLTDFQKEEMFELMTLYFDDVNREVFYRDLHEKNWVIVLEDNKSSRIEGFSTLMILEQVLDGIPIKAVFSGDTIVNRNYRWGETELIKMWGEITLSLSRDSHSAKLYWFLISMGYKTYRFLPVFFKEFYPRFDKPTPPFEKRIMDIFAYQKFPSEYNSESGIIHPLINAPLKPILAHVSSRLLKNPHINFFVKKNPLHAKGDELVCIAEISKENLKPYAYRFISNNAAFAKEGEKEDEDKTYSSI